MPEKLKAVAWHGKLNCGHCAAPQELKDGSIRINRCKEGPFCGRWFLHKFRATFCTKMLRQADARTVQALAGHSDLNTTLAYLAPATGKEMQAHANAINWTE